MGATIARPVCLLNSIRDRMNAGLFLVISRPALAYGAKTQLASKPRQIQDVEHISFIVSNLSPALRFNVSFATCIPRSFSV